MDPPACTEKVHVLHLAIRAFGSILRQHTQGGNFGGASGIGVDVPLCSSLPFLTMISFFSGFLLSSALTNEMTPYFR